ncbi:MAG TPA: hypothetical protein VFT96_11700 [Gemmatimonadaceae bacterium]|nr:hypothetical protein [Gemmatimonadaceae bacterium]
MLANFPPRRVGAIVALLTALVVSPESAQAQNLPVSQPASVDSLQFRPGQWGAIVGIGDDVAALGVLRFRSHRTAWVLNANGSAFTGKAKIEEVDAEQNVKSSGFTARLGLRRYRPLESRVVAAYSGAGITGVATWIDSDLSVGEELSGRMYGAGVYGELGVEYRAARYIALGVRSQADVTRRWGSETRTTLGGPPLRVDPREFGASIGRLEVLASLYF